ncbi:unnamed protein product [Adineta steineri]|uniref:Glucose-methanol-choline oxidoreductase N-terminal domain-containing protein n=1 Tax=Adineta steineri TaxID=433720 RepID=A0A819RVN7_9BILA|nr:unnamed protein product [Adineta steineri]
MYTEPPDNIVTPTTTINAQSIVVSSSKSRRIRLLFIVIIAAMVILLSAVIVILAMWANITKCSHNDNITISNSSTNSTTQSQTQEIIADFIIIGGGTAGCVVSARLAQYGFQTLSLSSGSNDTLNPMMKEKSLFGQLIRNPYFKHYLPVDSSPNLNNRPMDLLVWNTLGGNSINGGGIRRLLTDEWNYFINATGDPSFHIETMSKYYKLVENYTSTEPFSTSDIYGKNGFLKITHAYDSVFNNIWKNVASELDEAFTDELFDTIDYDFSFETSSFTNGIRILTDATALKFNLNEQTKQIESVFFISQDGLFNGIARKEYILSAGTFFSPHLLMLSGIGDRNILQENQIPTKHELKHVGKNLMDNGVIIIQYQIKNLTIGDSIPIAFINSQSRTTNNNSNTFFVLKEDKNTKQWDAVIFNPSPKSTIDSISLHSSNPLMSPKITVDYLKDPQDLNKVINAIHYIRKVMSTNTMKQYGNITELLPGSKETDLSTYIRNTLFPSSHFTSTCSIGRAAEDSVVDSHFKVHGISNLRVVDASVF